MTIAKAVTALVMGLLMMFLQQFGVTPDTPIASVVEILLTAAAVYYIPNKGKDAPEA
jgi:hypothetical protein